MSDPSKPTEDQELTPEARSLIAKARLFFLFTFGALLVGFIVVVGAIVYRATQVEAQPIGADYVITALRLPAGAQIVSAVAADGKLTVTFRVGAMTTVRIFDGRSGDLVREVPVLSE